MTTVFTDRRPARSFCPPQAKKILVCLTCMRLARKLLHVFSASTTLLMLMTTMSMAAAPKWITMQNENFHVYSTASERDTREVLNQFERVRGFFNQFVEAGAEKPAPVSIVIFGSEKEYQPFRINDFAAAYYTNHGDRDFIVIGVLGEESSQTASHEYTHLVVRHAGYSLPPWLNEGLAELYSTLEAAGSETEFGDVLPGRLYALNREPWVPLEVILAADQSSPYYNETKQAGSLYNESWALVHMLNTTQKYRAKFWDVVDAINNGTSSVQALVDTYGISFVTLESELRAYIKGSRFNQLKMKVKLDDMKMLASQSADMFEVREAQAELLMGLPNKQAEARTRLEELAHEDAKRFEPWANLGYLAWRAGNPGEAAEHFAKAVELGDRSPRLLMNFAQLAANDKPEASVTALTTLLELEPKNLDARLLLASVQMGQDKFAEAAMTVSEIKSVKTTQQRDNLLYLRAFAAMRLGYLSESRALAEQLQEVTTSMDFRFRATQILHRLDSVNSAEAPSRKLKAKRSGT